jgi:hypothetical protein
MTFRSILVNPMAKDWSLAMAKRRCRSRYMARCSEDHVAAIGSLNLNFGTFGRALLSWRSNGALK